MTTKHMKAEVDPTPVTESRPTANIHQTMDDVQYYTIHLQISFNIPAFLRFNYNK
jgi:hypothetical protein